MLIKLDQVCAECGGPLHQVEGKMAPTYCSPLCRKAFNNRQAQRGAQIMPFIMANYSARSHPMRKNGELRLTIDRMLAYWRDEDRAAGRALYSAFEHLIEDGTYLRPLATRKKSHV